MYQFETLEDSCVAGFPKVLRFVDLIGDGTAGAIAVSGYGVHDFWRQLDDDDYDWHCHSDMIDCPAGCSAVSNPDDCMCGSGNGSGGVCKATGTKKDLYFAADAILEGI